MVLMLFCVDARAITLSCAAARPTQDGARLTRLLKERLARAAGGLDLGFGVDAAQLVALKPSALQARETAALAPDGAHAQAGALEDLAERLAARLGPQAVLMAAPRASHWPERAQTFAPALASLAGAAFPAGHERPPLLLKKPEAITALAPLPDGAPAQFRWRRVLHRVARALGPERIGAEWWRADGPTRDYYRVETMEGRRLWLFRLGLYGRETNEPGWFVHGCWP
jgi:protein ImuB